MDPFDSSTPGSTTLTSKWSNSPQQGTGGNAFYCFHPMTAPTATGVPVSPSTMPSFHPSATPLLGVTEGHTATPSSSYNLSPNILIGNQVWSSAAAAAGAAQLNQQRMMMINIPQRMHAYPPGMGSGGGGVPPPLSMQTSPFFYGSAEIGTRGEVLHPSFLPVGVPLGFAGASTTYPPMWSGDTRFMANMPLVVPTSQGHQSGSSNRGGGGGGDSCHGGKKENKNAKRRVKTVNPLPATGSTTAINGGVPSPVAGPEVSSCGAASSEHREGNPSGSRQQPPGGDTSPSSAPSAVAVVKKAAAPVVPPPGTVVRRKNMVRIFDNDFENLLLVPLAAVRQFPPPNKNITRWVICRNFRDVDGVEKCTMNVRCNFVHVAVDTYPMTSHPVHINYVWHCEEACKYPTLAPGRVHSVVEYVPGNPAPANVLLPEKSSRHLSVTESSAFCIASSVSATAGDHGERPVQLMEVDSGRIIRTAAFDDNDEPVRRAPCRRREKNAGRLLQTSSSPHDTELNSLSALPEQDAEEAENGTTALLNGKEIEEVEAEGPEQESGSESESEDLYSDYTLDDIPSTASSFALPRPSDHLRLCPYFHGHSFCPYGADCHRVHLMHIDPSKPEDEHKWVRSKVKTKRFAAAAAPEGGEAAVTAGPRPLHGKVGAPGEYYFSVEGEGENAALVIVKGPEKPTPAPTPTPPATTRKRTSSTSEKEVAGASITTASGDVGEEKDFLVEALDTAVPAASLAEEERDTPTGEKGDHTVKDIVKKEERSEDAVVMADEKEEAEEEEKQLFVTGADSKKHLEVEGGASNDEDEDEKGSIGKTSTVQGVKEEDNSCTTGCLPYGKVFVPASILRQSTLNAQRMPCGASTVPSQDASLGLSHTSSLPLSGPSDGGQAALLPPPYAPSSPFLVHAGNAPAASNSSAAAAVASGSTLHFSGPSAVGVPPHHGLPLSTAHHQPPQMLWSAWNSGYYGHTGGMRYPHHTHYQPQAMMLPAGHPATLMFNTTETAGRRITAGASINRSAETIPPMIQLLSAPVPLGTPIWSSPSFVPSVLASGAVTPPANPNPHYSSTSIHPTTMEMTPPPLPSLSSAPLAAVSAKSGAVYSGGEAAPEEDLLLLALLHGSEERSGRSSQYTPLHADDEHVAPLHVMCSSSDDELLFHATAEAPSSEGSSA